MLKNQNEQLEQLTALALGAVEESEAHRLERLFASDDELYAELESLRDTASLLVYTADFAEPSGRIRSQILSAVREIEQDLVSEKKIYKTSTQNGNSPTRDQISYDALTNNSSFWNFAPTLLSKAAVFSAIIFFAGFVAVLYVYNNVNSQIAVLNQRLSESQQQLDEVKRQSASERDLIASPASTVEKLEGTQGTQQAKARLVFDKQNGKYVLFVEGLPDAPAGKAYQIWFLADPKKPTPGKTFTPDKFGRAILQDEIPVDSRKAMLFAVTLEDAKGATTPDLKALKLKSPTL